MRKRHKIGHSLEREWPSEAHFDAWTTKIRSQSSTRMKRGLCNFVGDWWKHGQRSASSYKHFHDSCLKTQKQQDSRVKNACKMLADLCPCFHQSPTKLCPGLVSFACCIVTKIWSFTSKSVPYLVIRALNRARFCVVCALNCARILVVRALDCRAGANSGPELDFLTNSNSGIGIELAFPSLAGIEIELELPVFELELNWNCHNWNWNWSRNYVLRNLIRNCFPRNWNPIRSPSYPYLQ